MSRPVLMRWNGNSMEPANHRWADLADREYVIGKVYSLAPYEERSTVTHNHFFACVSEAWSSLPEVYNGRFSDADELRKYALIKAGFSHRTTTVCATPEEAHHVAALVKPLDEYAIITIHDTTVVKFTPKSMSSIAMDAKEFQRAKSAVLEILSEMIGTTADALGKAAAPDRRPTL